MSQRYFELADDVNVPRRWHLNEPKDSHGKEVDGWQFLYGTPVHIPDRLRIPVEIVGKPLDFTEAGISIPVVHDRVASLFTGLAPDDVQMLPVDVEGQPDPYFILVATRAIDCIDEEISRDARGGSA